MTRAARAEQIAYEQEAAADAVSGLLKKKSKSRGWSPSKVLEQAEAMITSGDWSAATPRHMVMLYAWLHVRVYGVEAVELIDSGITGKRTRLAATSAATRMLAESFSGDPALMADFLRWVWKREGARELRAKQQGSTRSRIGWQFQFANRNLFTDWLVETNRGGKRV